MAENLWKLRQQRGLTVKQLAGKAGVKATNIYAYERGEPMHLGDRKKLARVLYVDETDIKLQSDPVPSKKKRAQKAQSTAVKPPPKAKKTPPPAKKSAPKPKPATEHPVRPGQITYLQDITKKLGLSPTAVTETIGKSLDELTLEEARHWIDHYLQQYRERSAQQENKRPPDTRRKRAHLPESVDEFEMAYLTARQEAGDQVTFTLFNGQEFTGRVVGFSPYNITIEQADGTAVTLQKLALAYYVTSHQPPATN